MLHLHTSVKTGALISALGLLGLAIYQFTVHDATAPQTLLTAILGLAAALGYSQTATGTASK